MKVAIAQIHCTPGDCAFNCSRIGAFAEQAKKKGCDAIVFPEMVDTGYDLTRLQEAASRWDPKLRNSPYAIARKAAREQGVYLFCGLSERVEGLTRNDTSSSLSRDATAGSVSDREGDTIYNSIVVFDPEGKPLGKYRKTHLAAYSLFQEDRYVSAGSSLETVRIGEMTWGLLICYDVRFPEVSRTLTLRGAQVLLLISAFPFPRLIHWKTLIRARAIENQTYVIAANRVGTDAGITFCGSSAIIDPYGVTVTEAAKDREELIVGEINRELIRSVREYMPVLEHRREELY